MTHRHGPEHTGLTFYSRVSASISHELKNTLAVINESGGFLEDVSLMAAKGVPLNPERLAALGGSILRQVQRANAIIGNMNRLAHSLDEPAGVVDLPSLIRLLLAVTERMTVTRGVTMSPVLPDGSVSLTTRPFNLETLIWLLIELSVTVCGESRSVEVRVSGSDAGSKVTFAGLDTLTDEAADTFFAGRVEALLEALGATLDVVPGKQLTVSLPPRLPELI
jgi:signal transduction histidine kinase